jgi:transposase
MRSMLRIWLAWHVWIRSSCTHSSTEAKTPRLIWPEHYYPETELLRQVEGVGVLTALTFVLTLEDPYRFEKSRAVGAYLGLVPATDQSGDRDPPEKHIFRRKATRC